MKRSNIFLVFTLCAIFGGVLSAGEKKPVEGSIEPFQGPAKFEIQHLFARQTPAERSGGRYPIMGVAVDGTVLVTWGSTGGPDDWWQHGFQVRRSEDGGKTWHKAITIANPGWNAGGLTVDETSGDILAFVESKYIGFYKDAKLTVYRSGDHGKTWKAEKTVIAPDKNGNVPAMCIAEHGIALQHGKHKGRLLRPSRWYAGGDNIKSEWPKMYTNAIYSDDGGKTWKTSDPFPAMGTGEAGVAELSDGRIYYNSRRHWEPEGAESMMRWEAWSYNGGATWKDLAESKVLPDGPLGRGSNGCFGGLVRLPIAGRDILIYSNCDSPDRQRDQQRKDVSVWASFDGAKTWPIKRLVFDGPSAYSSLTAGRPGTASEGWIYISLEGDKKHRYDGGYTARFNLSWLLAGGKTGDGTVPDWVAP